MISYSELDCLSNFSFLRGASHPQELVQRAAQLGYTALALADECSVSGAVRAHQEALNHALKLIIGSRFRTGRNELLVLAQTREGYGNLCELITLARSRAAKGSYCFDLDDILNPPSRLAHIRHLPDCLLIFKPAYDRDPAPLQPGLKALAQALPGRLWLGLTAPHYHADARHRAYLHELSQALELPWVALGQVEMHRRSRQPLHDVLAAIRTGKPVHECGHHLRPNAEHHLRSRLRLARLYPADALEQTQVIARSCDFFLHELRYEYPQEVVPQGMTPAAWLRQETLKGAQQRYPEGIHEKVRKQIEEELAIIAELKYEPYFLTVYDIVRYARSSGILCQGRGSAANSAVCFCLGITEVDPQHSKLLFSRFISRERNEPPDIDVDFEHHRREEVIQYIYRKYGHERAALAAVVIRYRLRSALRDTGKALGLPASLIDAVCASGRHISGHDDLLACMHRQPAFSDAPGTARRLAMWAELAITLLRFPRHLSQHPGGFVISHQRLARLVPMENAAMAHRTVVQWDKDDLDALGLLKVDVLGLGMLGVLQRCLQLIQRHRNPQFTLQTIPSHDPATFAMIQQADTIGVFQIESRAQMSMLPRLKPTTFYDLVIQIAIVRPGPIQGGMVHPYLKRRQKLEAVHYPNPELEPILERTLGVVIFQEQAMQVAMTAANFSADEADQLRRSMAAWHRNGTIDPFRERLITGMRKRNYDPEFAENLYQQLEGFGSYGFPESHAASFAKLAWCSAWIKCHEPAIFLAALLNSQPMGFYSPDQLVQDARRHGVRVRPADVLHSEWDSTIEPEQEGGLAVRLGLGRIKGMKLGVAQAIVNARHHRPFDDLHDLTQRAGLRQADLQLLAAANALHGLVNTRRTALWEAGRPVSHDLLARAPVRETAAPSLEPMPEGQEIVADYRMMGLTLGRHPVALLREHLRARGFESAGNLQQHYPDRRLARACGLVTIRQRPATANGTVFVTLEDETGSVNAIVYDGLARRQRQELTQSRLLGVYGIWQRQQGICHLKAGRLVDMSALLGQLLTRSRDFH